MTYKFSTIYFPGKQVERHCWLRALILSDEMVTEGWQFVHVVADTHWVNTIISSFPPNWQGLEMTAEGLL